MKKKIRAKTMRGWQRFTVGIRGLPSSSQNS